QALDVGEDDELAGAERDGDGGRGGVGVDVEHLGAVGDVGRDGRDDGDAAGGEEVLHGRGVHLDDVPDEPDVDRLAVDDGGAAPGPEQAAVLAGDAHRVGGLLVEEGDEVALHLAGEDHPHDLHRLGGGDAQPAAELRHDAEPVEHGGDLRAAAVDD